MAKTTFSRSMGIDVYENQIIAPSLAIYLFSKLNKGSPLVIDARFSAVIDKKYQAKLFNRFYRVENDKLKNVAGFGIVLYLLAEILRFHKSRIFVESTANVGSKFYFDLPVAHD